MSILSKKLSYLMLLSALSASGVMAADDDLRNMNAEQLQQHLLRMRERNNELEVKRQEEVERLQKEQEEAAKIQDLLRQIKEEEERKKALETPVVLAPVSTSSKTTADLAEDLVTESFKSLMGTGSSSHVDGQGNYVPSGFIQAKKKLLGKFKF